MPVSPELSDSTQAKANGQPKGRVNRRKRKLIVAGIVAAAAGTTAAFGSSAVLQQFDKLLPDASGISSFSRPGTVTILSADGAVQNEKETHKRCHNVQENKWHSGRHQLIVFRPRALHRRLRIEVQLIHLSIYGLAFDL